MSYQFSTTTSHSDETYLESFVESISASLPNELRRNMEHLRDLDSTSCKLMEDWRDRQDGCLEGVEERLLKLFRGEAADAAAEIENSSPVNKPRPGATGGGEKIAANSVSSQENKTRGTKRKHQQQESISKSPEKKVACVKCRAKKVRCDGKQPYCLLRLKVASPVESDDDSDDDSEDKGPTKQTADNENAEQNKNDLGEKSSPLSQDQLTAYLKKRGPPTNEEIRTSLDTHNPKYTSQRDEITIMYRDLQQFSREKISTANQLKSMVDMALGRLNRDMEKLEHELGIDPVVASSAAAVSGTNNISMGGGLGGIAAGGGLGMGGHHAHHAAVEGGAGLHHKQSHPNMAALSRSVSAAPVTVAVLNNAASLRRSSTSSVALPPPASAIHHQPYPLSIRGTVPPKAVQTANLAAIQVTPNSPDWILAKILSHDKSTKTYTLSDEDVQSNQIYKIPERQVMVLKGTERNKWARGDVVYAVYPDTTSFYYATVSTPPYNGFVMVQFKDDWDVNGVTHEKAVLLAHVMKVPPGAGK